MDVLGLGHFVSGTLCERNLIHVVGIFWELECLWLGCLVKRRLVVIHSEMNLFWEAAKNNYGYTIYIFSVRWKGGLKFCLNIFVNMFQYYGFVAIVDKYGVENFLKIKSTSDLYLSTSITLSSEVTADVTVFYFIQVVLVLIFTHTIQDNCRSAARILKLILKFNPLCIHS